MSYLRSTAVRDVLFMRWGLMVISEMQELSSLYCTA